MKKAVCLLVIILMVGIFFASSKASAEDKVVLRMITPWPKNQYIVQNALKIIDRVKQQSGGEVEIKYLGGPEVFTALEAIDVLGRGAVDLALSLTNYHQGKFPEVGIFGLPIWWTLDNYPDILHGSGVKDRIDELYQERFNVKFAGVQDMSGYVLATAKKPVKRLEDLKGLKLRGAGGMTTVLISSLGASAVTMMAEEVAVAAERGVIDGVIAPPFAITSYGWAPILKNMVMPATMGWGMSGYWMNLDKWKKLSERHKKALEEAFREQEIDGQKWIKRGENFIVNKLIEMGVQVYQLPADELARWRAGYEPALKKLYFKETGENGMQLYEMIDKYSKKQ